MKKYKEFIKEEYDQVDDIEELYSIKKYLEDKIEKNFSDKSKNIGDYRYQQIVNDLSDIEEQIEEKERMKK